MNTLTIKEAGRPSTTALEKQRRIEGGQYLKKIREEAGVTQRELATKVGLAYYTFISQIETGTAKPPENLYMLWSDVLGVDKREFAKRMLRYYHPHIYEAIWGLTAQ